MSVYNQNRQSRANSEWKMRHTRNINSWGVADTFIMFREGSGSKRNGIRESSKRNNGKTGRCNALAAVGFSGQPSFKITCLRGRKTLKPRYMLVIKKYQKIKHLKSTNSVAETDCLKTLPKVLPHCTLTWPVFFNFSIGLRSSYTSRVLELKLKIWTLDLTTQIQQLQLSILNYPGTYLLNCLYSLCDGLFQAHCIGSWSISWVFCPLSNFGKKKFILCLNSQTVRGGTYA